MKFTQENYNKIDKGMRVFTFLYFLLFFVLCLSVAIDVLDQDIPFLYTYDADYGYEPVFALGAFLLLSAAFLLPLVVLMPFDTYNGLYGVFKLMIYSTMYVISMALHFEMSHIDDIWPTTTNRILYEISNTSYDILRLFIVVCLLYPLLIRVYKIHVNR